MAYLSDTTFLSKDQTVVFDVSPTNAGGHYDNNTGIFTCPTNGFYYFSVAGYNGNNNFISLQLMKEESSGSGFFSDVSVRISDIYISGSGLSVPKVVYC